MQLDAGVTQEGQLVGEHRLGIDPHHRPDAQAEPRESQRPVRHRPAEPPAAWVGRGDVARRGAGDEDERSIEGSIGRHDVSCWAIPA